MRRVVEVSHDFSILPGFSWERKDCFKAGVSERPPTIRARSAPPPAFQKGIDLWMVFKSGKRPFADGTSASNEGQKRAERTLFLKKNPRLSVRRKNRTPAAQMKRSLKQKDSRQLRKLDTDHRLGFFLKNSWTNMSTTTLTLNTHMCVLHEGRKCAMSRCFLSMLSFAETRWGHILSSRKEETARDLLIFPAGLRQPCSSAQNLPTSFASSLALDI